MSILLFNNFILKPQPFTTLLNLIINHPLFQAKVIQYRQLFTQLELKPEHLIKLGTLHYGFMLPQFPSVQHKSLATELYQSLQLQQTTSQTKLSYTHLSEYLLKLCQSSVQNFDVRNCVGFLQLLLDRITDYYVFDVLTNQKKKIHYHFKLQLFDNENIINDTQMPQQFHRLMGKDIYYEQKIHYDEQSLQINQNQILIRQLKNLSTEVVPYGYICQDFLTQLINSDFETKNSYKLKSNRKLNHQKLQYWISPNQSVNNYIRDQVVNQQIFMTTGVLSGSHLPTNPINNSKITYSIARINTLYSHQNYYQKLKDIKQDKIKYFNILSQFFQRDQFNIDQITLTRQKLIARRKQHLLGIQSKQTIKKQQDKDFVVQARQLSQKIYEKMIQFHDDKRMELNIKELNQVLKPKLQEGKNINTIIQNHLSQYQYLPKDNQNSFVEDIIQWAKKQPLQLIVIGRPKSGKSTLARAVAKKYNLVYISVQSVINSVFQRIKFFEQNPPQADQDGNIIGGLTAIQKCIIQDLNLGKAINQQDILDLINVQLQKQSTQSKGFIIDLPFQYKKYWIDCIIYNKIILPKMNCRFFTHILQVQQSDQQWKYFSQSIMQKPEDLTITSAYDRFLLAKPKPAPVQGQDQQPPAEDQQKPLPLKQQNLLYIKWKDGMFSLIQHLTQHIHPRRYLKLQNAYQSVNQCLQLLEDRLYVIPLPKKLQGADKELLTVGHDQSKLVRKWSPWGIVDPVQLNNNKLINGKSEFAAEYAGRVFLFQNQNNLNAFLNSPRRFLEKLPKLPKNTNICITGPRKSGKKTLAKLLSQIYKLQIINFEQILERVILKQKSLQSHVPSNPQKRSNTVHLSEGELKQFSKGSILNAKDILPIILYQLGVALQKKPVGWGIQKDQNAQNQEGNQQQKKNAPAKKKKKDKNADDQRPKTPPIQDLSLKQIIPQINHQGKLNQIRGFILLNFPNNQEQLNSLKQFNIPIDRMIILNDNNQEAPNKILGQRLSDAQLQQVALFFAGIGPVKQALGQQVCKQISIDKSPQEILNKVRQLIDPFYLKVDDDNVNRVLADKTEQGDPIPTGFSGQYCPVVLKQGWLIKGKQQFEAGIQGKRFRFCGQKQFGQFKENPQVFLKKQNTVVPPRILFMGMRGVGLKTQLLKFNQKYKIPILNLKQTLIQQLQAEKNKRKTERYYKRGFKKPQFDEEGKMLEDEELNAQSPDFDKRVIEIQITRKIFEGINQIFINGNFFEVDEEKISTNIVELLTEARRLPQIVYVLKSDQPKWLQRNLNRAQIQRQLQEQIEKIRAQKRQKLQEARKAALQAGQQFNPPAQEEQQLPKLQQKIAAKQQSLKAQRQADLGALQGFIEAFRGLNIQVIQINCQREVKHVSDKINYTLKTYLQDRVNKWQKYNMLQIERHRVRDFLNNFLVKESRFGKYNPLSLTKTIFSFPLIYNERIYYLKDEQQRQMIMKNPQLLQNNLPIPHDVITVPGILVLGKNKTGKTTLAQSLAHKLGMVYLSFKQIINSFQQNDIQILSILNQLKQGKTLLDEQIVKLIVKRLQLADCQKNGWILDGLPQNKNQVDLLNKRGVVPVEVFVLSLTDAQIKKRVIKAKSQAYEFDVQVTHQRLEKNRKYLAQIELHYQNKYNNVRILDGNLSKWGLYEVAQKIIISKTKAKRQLSRALALSQAADVSQVGMNFNAIINNLSDYQNYCPISYKLKRQYVRKCLRQHYNLALYNKKLYVFNTRKQLNDFRQNPQTFINRGPSFMPPTQVELQDFKHIADKSQNKGYCMIELLRKKLVKGNFSFGLIYKNKLYLTSTPKSMKSFVKNPTLYQMVKLPDKMPVQFEKKNELKKIAKRNDCTAFLEHHLSNIMMRSLAQLGYRRPKYPTLSSKQSALKFLAISLKATNPNKDDQYRQKYTQQLQKFIKQCSLSQQIRSQVQRKNKQSQKWQQADEQNLIKLCEQYSAFMKQLQSEDKNKYFSKFIR